MKNNKQKLTVFFFLLAFISVVAVGIMGFSHFDKELSRSIQKQTDIARNRRQCEMQGHTLEKASNYLSTQAWYFVVTGQEKYLFNYWDEVENAQRRDRAISTLSSLSVTSGEQSVLQNAKDKSDDLIRRETWAMRLAADSLGMADGSLPRRKAGTRSRIYLWRRLHGQP